MSKTVWITGASSGVGREFARRYARLGLAHPHRPPHRPSRSSGRRAHRKHSTFCRILPADLEQESECARLCEALTDEHRYFHQQRRLWRLRRFLETSGEKELSMAKVNVLAMHQLFKFAVKKDGGPGLRHRAQRGVLRRAAAGRTLYGGLLRHQSVCCQPDPGRGRRTAGRAQPGLRLRLCPGPVDTEFNERADVVFALRGISPELCVEEAMRGDLCTTRPSSSRRPSCGRRRRPSGSCRWRS